MKKLILLALLCSASVYGQDRYLIEFNRSPGPPTAEEESLITNLGGRILYRYSIVPGMAVELPSTAARALVQSPMIAFMESDGEVHAIDTELDNSWGVKRIGSGTIHDSGNKGAGIKVVVIDTGVDYNHPDLSPNYRGGYDCYNNDNDPFDDHYHGTHVSGTIAARDDDLGVVGVAPEADLYAVKVLGSTGSGTWAQVVCGVDWAVTNGMQVTNNSYGGTGYSQLVDDAFQAAWNAGVLSIAAAGNSGGCSTCDTVLYPARLPTVMAVAALDSNDNRAGFSSTGLDVEISAPGVSILSAAPGGGYQTLSGTSMASPHVVGTAALVISQGLFTNNQDVRDVLISTADPLGEATLYGAGIVNAADAASGDPINKTPNITITEPSKHRWLPGDAITFAGTADDTEDGDITADLIWVSNISGQIGTGSTFNVVLPNGDHKITASATDSGGKTGTSSIDIRIAPPNQLPVVTISEPSDGSEFAEGTVIRFAATATDPEDGDITGSIFWLIDPGPPTRVDGPIINVALPPGTHEVSAWAKDSEQSFGAAFIHVTVTVPMISITDISYEWFGGPTGFKHFNVLVSITPALDGVVLLGTLTGEVGNSVDVGALSKSGLITIRTRNLPAICYTLEVGSLLGPYEWNGLTPPNEGCPVPRKIRTRR